MHPISEPLAFNLSSADACVLHSGALLYGWSFIEASGGAGVTFDVLDGEDAARGLLIAPISLNGGESTRDFFGSAPMLIRVGLTVGNVTGDVRGSLFATPVWRMEPEVLATFGQRV